MPSKNPPQDDTPGKYSALTSDKKAEVQEGIRRLKRAAEHIQEARRVIKSK